ncbi:putative monooxygenase [Talaromyces proteolyticus]|uniref:Monooxygenase n=1 Tax=Talaromyces proteolyticus TaxID=1131652 RepID=A0AAD4KG79_9EURO|nr:putative monooxygenase [Talaromyces proteolyticus]KAH8690306.1 putative monooxygenase [Talaromyces proteolyticus]
MEPNTGQFIAGKRIIVAGASFAGLAFVTALEQLWNSSLDRPEVVVFEQHQREESIQKDPYVLCINGGSQNEGLVVLQQLDLLDDIRPHSTLNSGDIRVWSGDWKQLSSINPKPYGNLPAATMRISRQDLKRILVEKAEKTKTIWKWGSPCLAAERLPNGKIRVKISTEEGSQISTHDCDLLVAADGANSIIRASFRPNDMKLQYTGLTQIGGISRLPNGLPHPIHEDYGLQMSSGEGICCIYNPFGCETIGWALSWRQPEREVKSGPFTQEELAALKEEALKTGSMFQEPFKTIVEATDPQTPFIRPAKEKTAFAHDSSLKGAVFIGDANHVLSPYEFVGANLALKDGWDLAEQICCNTSMETTVAAYDKLSIPRFEDVYNFSHTRIGFGHSTGLKWTFYKHGMAVQRVFGKK